MFFGSGDMCVNICVNPVSLVTVYPQVPIVVHILIEVVFFVICMIVTLSILKNEK